MKTSFGLIFLFGLFTMITVCGQNTFHAVIINEVSQEPLTGATIQMQNAVQGAIADAQGRVEITDIPNGAVYFVIQFVGFKNKKIVLSFPRQESDPVVITLAPDEEELDEVIIRSTRSSRTIRSIPTRVEFIGAEELEEKITMQPGNIRMVLSESTGIQTQQTSVSSANATIRIQGLDGRYTQLLKDGFPLFGGFSGGLSIMQIPPLDLQQVEVIKGSASTLYGGGAIAGLINLISKQPTEERELTFFVNGTSARGLDLSTYYGEKFDKLGVTLYASRNSNEAYDPSDQGFSAIPQFTRYTVNPRLFFYLNDRATMMVALNAAKEKRTGGDMQYLKGDGDDIHVYYEKNNTDRVSTQFTYDYKLNDNYQINLKNSFNFFNRAIRQPDYFFGGNQLASFSELSVKHNGDDYEWVLGTNLWTDKFSEEGVNSIMNRDYSSLISGVFFQNLWKVNSVLTLESGLRADFAVVEGKENDKLKNWFVLPRVSALVQYSKKLSSRVGAGLGYKTPGMFTEKAEEQVFRNVMPINFNAVRSERSFGINADVNYTTMFSEDWSLNINQLFFYTRIQSPLIFNRNSLLNDVYVFENASGHIDAAGAETNIKLTYKDLKLFWGYTHVNAQNHFNSERVAIPLTARNRINAILMYELEDNLRLGMEAFYFSPQKLSNGEVTTDYWIFGFSAQKKWEHFSVFINFENFTDIRQTNFGTIYSGSISQPQFQEVYAPLDGFVFNAGFFLRL